MAPDSRSPSLRSLALLALACASCSSDPATAPPADPIDLPAFADAYCGLLAPCCQKAGLSTSGVSCHAMFSSSDTTQTYSAANAGTCVQEIRTASSGAGFCGGGFTTAACEAVFTSKGTKKPGEACTQAFDCAPSSKGPVRCFSANVASGPTQTCLVERVGQAGDHPCVGTKLGSLTVTTWYSSDGPGPPEGFICDRGGGLGCSPSRSCTALTAVGSACTDSSACAVGAFCNPMALKCEVRGGAGAACNSSDGCTDAFYCDFGKSQCVARAAVGADCGGAVQCTSDATCTDGACKIFNIALLFLCGG
jgi:hypothetical protein